MQVETRPWFTLLTAILLVGVRYSTAACYDPADFDMACPCLGSACDARWIDNIQLLRRFEDEDGVQNVALLLCCSANGMMCDSTDATAEECPYPPPPSPAARPPPPPDGCNRAANWHEVSFVGRSWQSIASSSDGTKLAAVVDGGNIWTSADAGANWTAVKSEPLWSNFSFLNSSSCIESDWNFIDVSVGVSKRWRSIASSSDGTKLAAVVDGGNIWTSADAGANWTAVKSEPLLSNISFSSNCSEFNWTIADVSVGASKAWRNIASSSDGTKLAAVVDGGNIWISADSGVSWTAVASQQSWSAIASSSDGKKLAAVVNGGNIWTSADSGVSWTAVASQQLWSAIASSSDGKKLAAVVSGGAIWTSANSGAIWNEVRSIGNHSWQDIASSSDGVKLTAVVDYGNVWTSANSGRNWTEDTSLGWNDPWGCVKSWRSVASSGDSAKVAAVVDGGTIWTYAWPEVASEDNGFDTRRLIAPILGGVGAYFVAKLLLKKCFAPPDERKTEKKRSGCADVAADDDDADWEASDARESDEGETV